MGDGRAERRGSARCGSGRFPEAAGDGISAETEEGVAQFPWIGLGLALQVGVLPDSGQGLVLSARGPRVAGETVSIDVDLPALVGGPSRIHGRLVDVSGSPLAATEYSQCAVSAAGEQGGATWSSSGTTDEHARFTIALPFGASTSRHSVAIRARPPGTERDAEARLDLGLLRDGSELDVGDLVLQQVPQIATGRVVDERGEPIAGAALGYQPFGAAREDECTPGEPFVSDPGGRFWIGGHTKAVRGRLEVEAPGHAPATVSFAPGASDLRVALARHGAITGSLTLDPGLTVEDVVLEVVRRGSTTHVPLSATGGGRFETSWIETGFVDLRLRLPHDPEPLAIVERFRIVAGDPVRDERLEGLDLRCGVRKIRIDIFDESKGRLTSILGDLDGGARSRDDLASLADILGPKVVLHIGEQTVEVYGNPAFLVSKPPLDLTISAPGYAPVRLTGVTSDRTVVLR